MSQVLMRVVDTRSRLKSGDVPASYHRTVALGGLILDNRSQLVFLAPYIDILEMRQTSRFPMSNSVVEARASPLAEIATAMVHVMIIFAAESKYLHTAVEMPPTLSWFLNI